MAYSAGLEKDIFPPEIQERIVTRAKQVLKEIFNSDDTIKEILVFGSAQTRKLGIYKHGKKHRGMDRSDIDVFFLFENEPERDVYLKNGVTLTEGNIITDAEGNWVHAYTHAIMCAGLCSKYRYYRNLDKPFPHGFDFTRNSEKWFSRD